MDLFKVTLRGMTASLNTVYGVSYVVAPDLTTAYETVRKYLDEKNLGFRHEREVDTVELLASEGDYPECKHQLFIVGKGEAI